MDGPWLRIGEVARRTGLTQRTLRHYDQLGLLVPGGRSDGDYRLYSRADLERLLEIQHLKSLGLSLAEVAEALDDPGADAATLLARHVAEVERRVAQEEELLTRLRRLQQAAGTGWEDVLEVIRLTERLRHPDAPVRFEATLRGDYMAARGKKYFDGLCMACHGIDGKGNQDLGAPDLTARSNTLYPNTLDSIRTTIIDGRHGVMPAHRDLLGETRSRLVAAYVWSLSNTPATAQSGAPPERQ